jgi:hypothetical protein
MSLMTTNVSFVTEHYVSLQLSTGIEPIRKFPLLATTMLEDAECIVDSTDMCFPVTTFFTVLFVEHEDV